MKKRGGEPGTAHIITSRTGLVPFTRFGQITTARLCASMRLDAERRETSCSKSRFTKKVCQKETTFGTDCDVRRM